MKKASLPPGPTPLPIIGNAADMPKTRPHEKFEEWAKKYGPIVHITVLGLHIIIVNDPAYAYEMLESRGQLYSHRPSLMMAGHMVGWDQSPVLIQSNETWSIHRKHFQGFMGSPTRVEEYESILREEVDKVLDQLVKAPENHVDHFQFFAGSVFLRLVYGYTATDENDSFVAVVNRAMQGFSEMTEAGAFAVDMFPFLRHVPKWFPGAGWKSKAVKYREDVEDMLQRPYDWTKEQMKSGSATPCFITSVLEEEKDLTPEKERIIKWSAAGIHAGGCLTTGAALSCFLLGIVRHPDELEKAQAEIDAVVGRDRLPTFADRHKLPYLEALCMEIHRVYPLGQTGLQHVPIKDDVYKDYLIPQGSIIVPFTGYFNRNEISYPNPDQFSPERFVHTKESPRQKDPRDYTFGYGVRRCPGVYLAQAMQWIVCATLISKYDIKSIVKDGKPVIPPANFKEGLVALPEKFEYVITPRI